MKRIAYILSFYLLGLSTISCYVPDNCGEEIEQTQTNHNNEHRDDCENCSPFALCGNCAGFIVNILPFQVAAPALPVDKIFTGFETLHFPQFISSFWQPPKLC